MGMTISLPPEEEKKLSERAAAIGQDMVEYVHHLIRKDIELSTFAELFSPVHWAVRESGMNPAELDDLLQSAIEDSRANRKQ